MYIAFSGFCSALMLACSVMMFRPGYKGTDNYIGEVFRLLWLIPMLGVFLVWLLVSLWVWYGK